MHCDPCSSLEILSRAKQRYSSKCFQTILLSSMPISTLLQRQPRLIVSSSEELKELFKAVDNDRICKTLAISNTAWRYNIHVALILVSSGSVDPERQRNAPSQSWVKKIVFWHLLYKHGGNRVSPLLQTTD